MAEPVKSLSHRLQAALADALLAAYVAFALFCLTLGFKTVDSVGGLTLKSRPVLLATVVGIVFVGRLLLNLFWWNGNWKMPRPAWRPVWPIPSVSRYGADNGALLLVARRRALPDPRLHPREDLPSRPAAPLPARPVDPRPYLRDARLGAQYRGRARWPSRPRLCRLLCGRRLHACAARRAFRPRFLDLPAARRAARRAMGRGPRLPGASPARRLSRHRDARLRRDRPHRAAQLDRGDQRAERHLRISRSRHSSASPSQPADRKPSQASSAFATIRSTPSSFSIT